MNEEGFRLKKIANLDHKLFITASQTLYCTIRGLGLAITVPRATSPRDRFVVVCCRP